MANGYIVPDFRGGFFVRAMNHGKVLNVHFVAHLNAVHITADYAVEPETALIAGFYITNNGCIFSNETIVSE
jgi:hypothetical protein